MKRMKRCFCLKETLLLANVPFSKDNNREDTIMNGSIIHKHTNIDNKIMISITIIGRNLFILKSLNA